MPLQNQLIGLSSEEAKQLQDIAKTEINKVRKVNNLLAHEKFPPGTHNVKHELIDRAGGHINVDDRNMIPFVELDTVIQVEREQLDDPGKGALKKLIADASRVYGQAMDVLLVNGQNDKGKKENSAKVSMPASCNVKYGYKNEGLRDGGGKLPIPIKGATPDLHELVQGIMSAKSELQNKGHEGPYNLILSPELYHEAVRPAINLQLPITTVKELLNVESAGNNSQMASKITESSALNGLSAVLFKPDEIDVACSYDGDLQVLSIATQIQLRLFGAFALRIKNPTSLASIIYKK